MDGVGAGERVGLAADMLHVPRLKSNASFLDLIVLRPWTSIRNFDRLWRGLLPDCHAWPMVTRVIHEHCLHLTWPFSSPAPRSCAHSLCDSRPSSDIVAGARAKVS